MKNWNAEKCVVDDDNARGNICVNGKLCNTKKNEKSTRRGNIERKEEIGRTCGIPVAKNKTSE